MDWAEVDRKVKINNQRWFRELLKLTIEKPKRIKNSIKFVFDSISTLAKAEDSLIARNISYTTLSKKPINNRRLYIIIVSYNFREVRPCRANIRQGVII